MRVSLDLQVISVDRTTTIVGVHYYIDDYHDLGLLLVFFIFLVLLLVLLLRKPGVLLGE